MLQAPEIGRVVHDSTCNRDVISGHFESGMRRGGEECGSGHVDGVFESLYRTHYDRVRRFVTRRVAFHEIDDVLVETFSVALRRGPDVPTEFPQQVGWLLVTARHVIGNHHRSSRRARALTNRLAALAPAPAVSSNPVERDAFISDEQIERIFHALPEDDQFILTAVAWDECTPEELGVILGCTPGAAKTRLSRARARFRDGVGRGRGHV